MLFNSIQFALFLPIVFALYWLTPQRFRWALLLAASYYFYMSWNAKYIVLILLTTGVSYLAGRLLETCAQKRRKKLIVSLTLIVCLGVLFVFKYFGFFWDALTQALHRFAVPLHPLTLQLVLPVGISFYTFQTLGYVIDVYRGDVPAERHFGKYAAFIAFFPQLVAGPIERTGNLLPQIRDPRPFDYARAVDGMQRMAWGFYKKMVVADNLARYVDRVYADVFQFKGLSLVLASVLFAFQIYCDFSGYSDIAIGCAKLLGVDLAENFRRPYLSASIREFWSRWHISLSTWFRDYLYIPLGGNRVGKVRHWLNLLATFLVSGLWHGANWTFLVWGGVHGAAQIAENALHLVPKKPPRGWRRCVRIALVVAFTTAAWVFFRADSIGGALHVFRHALDGITAPYTYLYNGFLGVGMSPGELRTALLVYLLPLIVLEIVSEKIPLCERLRRCKAPVRHIVYALLVLLVLFFHATGEVSFVYFQF
ncbi:MAG: MBOAT family protein [Clostridia bacterium]|nr:MBOAT family protein [Clostridia bacterium]